MHREPGPGGGFPDQNCREVTLVMPTAAFIASDSMFAYLCRAAHMSVLYEEASLCPGVGYNGTSGLMRSVPDPQGPESWETLGATSYPGHGNNCLRQSSKFR